MCVSHVVGGSGDSSIRVVPEERTKRSKEELRELWRKAILQQILLQRMERENQKLQGELDELRRIKTHTKGARIASFLVYSHFYTQKVFVHIFKHTLNRHVKISFAAGSNVCTLTQTISINTNHSVLSVESDPFDNVYSNFVLSE